MEEPTNVILRVLRGSQAHGIALPGADEDTGFVYVRDPLDYFSLAGRPEKESWSLRDGDDATGFEVQSWIKDVLYGDPNHLEFLWAPVIGSSYLGDNLRAMRGDLWDAKAVMERAIGYAKNKRNVMLDPKTVRERRPKFATALLRVLYQARVLLETGDMPVKEIANSEIGPILVRIKRTNDWSVGEVVDREAEMVEDLRKVYMDHHSVRGKVADWDKAQEFVNRCRKIFWGAGS